VTWLGPLADVVPLWQAADLALVPSLAAEAFGLAAAEAMACATPALCSAVGGLPELVGELGETLLVAPDDPDALARGIARLLQWRRTDPSLGSRARERITGRFSLERMVSDTEEVLSRSARGAPPTSRARR
jgi:glycosyltransferase involved in cell wall biosynthesis